MDHLLYAFDAATGVATLTLNRPTVFNSVNRALALDIQARLREIHYDDAVRAVLLTANGKAFCAGQDIGELTGPDAPEMPRIVRDHYNPIVVALRALPKPVVVAVNGVAAGAGANIALAGDVVVAVESAAFIQAFSKIGLIPDSGGTYTLPRLVGLNRASALMMTGDKVTAAEALTMGMIYKVFPAETFEAESHALAAKLAAMPTRGLALTKALLNQTFSNDLTAQLNAEAVAQDEAGSTADYAEGIAAFMEKRPAKFVGK